jgi:hypothetical protein
VSGVTSVQHHVMEDGNWPGSKMGARADLVKDCSYVPLVLVPLSLLQGKRILRFRCFQVLLLARS